MTSGGFPCFEGNSKLLWHFIVFWLHAFLDARKQAITVEDLLIMTSGLPWGELGYLYTDPNNDWYRMTTSTDWEQFIIDWPMDYNPGQHTTQILAFYKAQRFE